MAWRSLLLAFLAGYGLMSLLLWLLFAVWRWFARPWAPSALLLVNGRGERLEGIVRGIYDLWERGRLSEVLVAADKEEREIALRLACVLPGVKILPAGASPAEALAAARGASIWLIDLARLPEGVAVPVLFPPPFLIRQKKGEGFDEGYRPVEDE
ncbi:MAG: hypothetical protein ACUVRM_05870 [Bacillota bacterium]